MALRVAVSIALLWFPLRHVSVVTVANQIAAVDGPAILEALLALALATVAAAMRWSTILRVLGNPRGMKVTYPLSLIGIFFGQALPAGIGGDVVRVWLVCKTGLTTRTAISSVLGDRLAGFLAILIIVTAGLPALRSLVSSTAVFYGLIFVLCGGYAGIAVAMSLDRLPAVLHRFRAVRGLAGVAEDLRASLLSPPGLLVLLFAVCVQLCNVLAVFALANGLHLPIAFVNCLLIVSFANVLQTVPISVAGWGVRESFFVAAFGSIGIAAPPALAVSVIFGLLFLLSSLPGGVLWLVQGWGSSTNIREITPLEVTTETQ